MPGRLNGVLHQNLNETPIAVLDFETTGLTPGFDRVVEVSVVRVDPGAPPRLIFDTMINPDRRMAATEVHGLTRPGGGRRSSLQGRGWRPPPGPLRLRDGGPQRLFRPPLPPIRVGNNSDSARRCLISARCTRGPCSASKPVAWTTPARPTASTSPPPTAAVQTPRPPPSSGCSIATPSRHARGVHVPRPDTARQEVQVLFQLLNAAPSPRRAGRRKTRPA